MRFINSSRKRVFSRQLLSANINEIQNSTINLKSLNQSLFAGLEAWTNFGRHGNIKEIFSAIFSDNRWSADRPLRKQCFQIHAMCQKSVGVEERKKPSQKGRAEMSSHSQKLNRKWFLLKKKSIVAKWRDNEGHGLRTFIYSAANFVIDLSLIDIGVDF